MSNHVLLNLLNELRKRAKMRSFAKPFIAFLQQVCNTGAQMIDFIYHMTL